jgi:thymidylate synthase
VQMALAKSLNLTLGHYRHHAGSLHVYEKHFPLAISAQENYASTLDITPYLQPTMRDTQLYASAVVDDRIAKLNA